MRAWQHSSSPPQQVTERLSFLSVCPWSSCPARFPLASVPLFSSQVLCPVFCSAALALPPSPAPGPLHIPPPQEASAPGLRPFTSFPPLRLQPLHLGRVFSWPIASHSPFFITLAAIRCHVFIYLCICFSGIKRFQWQRVCLIYPRIPSSREGKLSVISC